MKKIITLLSTVALVVMGAMTSSCNKMEKDNGPRFNPDGSVTYTISASMSTLTKALAETGENTLQKTFSVGDQIKVTYDGSNTATGEILSSSDIYHDGKAAKFAVTFASAPTLTAGSSVKYEYPYAHSGLTGQNGTLATLASTFDYAKWEGVVASEGQLPTNAVLANQYAIIKFTLKDKAYSAAISPSAFTISDGTSTVELSSIPASTYSTNGAGVLFVAFPAAGSSKTITLSATVDSNTYALEKSGVTFSRGLFYEITAKMEPRTITWNATKIDNNLAIYISGDWEEYNQDDKNSDGITVTVNTGSEPGVVYFSTDLSITSNTGTITFDSNVGNISKIEINHSGEGQWVGNGDAGPGWPDGEYGYYEASGGTFIWSDSPSTSVTLWGNGRLDEITSIVFTLE